MIIILVLGVYIPLPCFDCVHITSQDLEHNKPNKFHNLRRTPNKQRQLSSVSCTDNISTKTKDAINVKSNAQSLNSDVKKVSAITTQTQKNSSTDADDKPKAKAIGGDNSKHVQAHKTSQSSSISTSAVDNTVKDTSDNNPISTGPVVVPAPPNPKSSGSSSMTQSHIQSGMRTQTSLAVKRNRNDVNGSLLDRPAKKG